MSYWNYRVIRKDVDAENVQFCIHEVYYDDEGKIEAHTENSVEPYGETQSELREDIKYFMSAFKYPILKEKKIDDKYILVEDEDDQEINDGHYFELMDRASVALSYIHQFLGSHPVVRKNKELKEIYEKSEIILNELYQKASELEFKKCRR